MRTSKFTVTQIVATLKQADAGIPVMDLDLSTATGLLARRYRVSGLGRQTLFRSPDPPSRCTRWAVGSGRTGASVRAICAPWEAFAVDCCFQGN